LVEAAVVAGVAVAKLVPDALEAPEDAYNPGRQKEEAS
jgi:hypothetical protein